MKAFCGKITCLRSALRRSVVDSDALGAAPKVLSRPSRLHVKALDVAQMHSVCSGTHANDRRVVADVDGDVMRATLAQNRIPVSVELTAHVRVLRRRYLIYDALRVGVAR